MNDQIKQIAERLRGLRDVLELTAEDIARDCEISAEEYRLAETGDYDISVSMLQKIARKYGIALDALMFGEEPKMSSYFLTRAGKGTSIERTKAYKYQSLAAGFMNRNADPFIVTVEPKPDIEPRHYNSHSEQEFNLREIARPALFIPESLYAKNVLELFKKNKNKFGVVVNEYGSTEGIITLHDLTESIFGDILEEDDTEEEEIVRRQDGSLLVEASMNIGDFMEEMGILSYDDIESEDFTTLGGLAMFLIGRIPKAGDIFTYKNLQFEVVDMDRGRVDKLLVIKREEEE